MAQNNLIPLCRPWIDEAEIEAVSEVLASKWISTGPKTTEFEQRFAEFIGVKHALAVSSCTAALHLSLIAAGVGEGDEVITTPYTFTATAEAIGYTGAKPVFVDIDPETLNIDVGRVEDAVTLRTKAIIPANYNGHRVGSIGNLSAFSFYANKNLSTGEGGMITTNSDRFATAIKRMFYHGMSKDSWARRQERSTWYYEVVSQGYKYNMTDIQAAMGLCQLLKIEKQREIRCRYSKIYTLELRELPNIITPQEQAVSSHAWHLYIIQLRTLQLKISRDEFIDAMRKANIECGVHYIPLNLFPFYQQRYGYQEGDFPHAESAFKRVVSLPMHPGLTEDDIHAVIDTLKEILS